MPFKQTNTFNKMMRQDPDVSAMPPDAVRKVLNGRYTTKDGQTYIITNFLGNRLEFALTPGFVPLGKRDYNGILYIVSFNETTSETEIGCFPSPNFAAGTTTLERVYRPIYNLLDPITGIVGVFRSTLMGSRITSQMEIELKEEYDNTINMYITDNYNPLRVINSGFDQDGVLVISRQYENEDFNNSMILYSSSVVISSLEPFDVTTGGIISVSEGLDYGNYIISLRWVTESLDPTHIICRSNAVQISAAEVIGGAPQDSYQIQGGSGTDTITPSNVQSDKGIHLAVNNPNESYMYCEVIVSRYYSSDDGLTIKDIWLIDKRYLITDIIVNGIKITGGEAIVPFTTAEEIQQHIPETVCKSITQLDKRLWGVNWKRLTPDKTIFRDFAAKVKVGYHTLGFSDDVYKFPNAVYNYTGYFSEEVYPFGMGFLLNDGTETESFPVRGADFYHILAGWYNTAGTTQTGITRFPNRSLVPGPGEDNVSFLANPYTVNIMGVKFDMSDITAADIATISGLVVGFFFTRGGRKINMSYQGLALGCSKGDIISGLGNIKYNASIPCWEGVPLLNQGYVEQPFSKIEEVHFKDSANVGYVNTADPDIPEEYLGLFSMDYLFENQSIYGTSGSYMESKGELDFVSSVKVSHCFPTLNYIDVHDYNFSPFGCTLNNIVEVGKGGYTSVSEIGVLGEKMINIAGDYMSSYGTMCQGGYVRSDEINFECNRNMQTPKYLGLNLSSDIAFNYYKNLVSIYQINPNQQQIDGSGTGSELNDEYSSSEEMFKISNVYPIEDLTVTGTLIYKCFKGDCFLQRTFFKQMSWFSSDFDMKLDGKVTTDIDFWGRQVVDPLIGDTTRTYYEERYAHGLIIGLVSENRMNTAMRHISDSEQFYPNVISKNYNISIGPTWVVYPQDEVVLSKTGSGIEGFRLNQGYNRVLDDDVIVNYDPTLPFEKGQRPVRVRHTDAQIAGSFIDAYRNMEYSYKKDYDIQYGPMQFVTTLFDRLITVQKSSINQHYVNEKQILNDPNAGEIVLGVGEVLSAQARKLGNFGTQHQWSIVNGDRAIYGVDFKERVIWRIGLETGNQGQSYLMAKDLTKEVDMEKWIYDVIDSFFSDPVTDKTEIYPDTPIATGQGIVSGYDRSINEALFTFLNFTEIIGTLLYEDLTTTPAQLRLTFTLNDNIDEIYEVGDKVIFYTGTTYEKGIVLSISIPHLIISVTHGAPYILINILEGAVTLVRSLSKTIAYNEEGNAFSTEYSFTPSIYMNIKKDMYTPDIMNSNTDMYLHEKGDYTTFYGHLYHTIIELIVNGKIQEGDASSYTKMFESVEILSEKEDFYRVTYNTEFQEAIHFPFVQATAFWLDPKWSEHKWYFPIVKQTSVLNEDYDTGSQMRDTWMKITLDFFQNVSTFVKSVVTSFNISKS